MYRAAYRLFQAIYLLNLIVLSACASKAALTEGHRPEDYGEVGIYSTPPRAVILVDGNEIVKSPAIICRVKKNKAYQFKVTRDGYQPWEETVNLQEKRQNFHIKLIKNP